MSFFSAAEEIKENAKPHGISSAEFKLFATYFGSEAVGHEIPSPILFDVHEYFPLKKQDWNFRIVDETFKVENRHTRLAPLQTDVKANTLWSFDQGLGEVELLTKDNEGQLLLTATEDRVHDTVTHFQPYIPLLPVSLNKGRTQTTQINVTVYDLADSKELRHSGQLELRSQYLGNISLLLKDGRKDALVFKSMMQGKIGPAEIKSTLYRLYSKGKGMVASIEQRDVSAYLIYQEHFEVGQLMLDGAS